MSRLVKSSNMFVISKNMFRRETPLRCFIDGRLVLLIFILCFLVANTEAAGKMKAIRPRDTLLTGVCENVTGSNYQNYVSYNQKRSYYRDGTIVGIYTLVVGSQSLAKCGQLCGMDWETLTLAAGAIGNLAQEDFTSQQLCEAFIFNPKNGKCVLMSGLSGLNLRESNRYYSGYLDCPEPSATFASTILQPPGSVTVVNDCNAIPKTIILNWETVNTATGYLITCIDAAGTLSFSASTTANSYTTSALAASTTYRCYVSAYKYGATSKGSPTDPTEITTCAA